MTDDHTPDVPPMLTGADQPSDPPPAPEANELLVMVTVRDGAASAKRSASGSGWTDKMVVGALAAMTLEMQTLSAECAKTAGISLAELLARVARCIDSTAAAQAKPGVVVAPAGFNPARMRLTRPGDN